METISPAKRFLPSARSPLAFVLHQCFGAWGAIYAVPWAVAIVEELRAHLGFRVSLAQVRWVLYGAPFFPAQIAFALTVGWILGGALRHRSALWVWVFPLLALCLAFFGLPLLPDPSYRSIYYPEMYHLSIPQIASLRVESRMSYYFGWGMGIQPPGQLALTLPFYSAVAYSLGAWISRSVLGAPIFFETVRHLRKARLLFLVALPWFCLKLTFDWRQSVTRYPVLRTWPALRFYLQSIMVAGLLVASAFGIAVSVAGWRFAVTRFFLNPAKPGTPRTGVSG
jgi:hypothetical protein